MDKYKYKYLPNKGDFNDNNLSTNISKIILSDDPTNTNFCSNPLYKTIITLVLFGILLYLIWYLCKKQYYDEKGIIEVSTPFN